MTISELDAFLREHGVLDGIGKLDRQSIAQMTRNDTAKVQGLILTYLSRFTDPNIAFDFDHDGGHWVGMTSDGYLIPLDTYILPKDNRTMWATGDWLEALDRIENGYAWDGTQVASGKELEDRKALAVARSTNPFFRKVDPKMLRYGTILGMTADQLYYTSSSFQEWLAFNYRNRQEV